MDSEVGKADVPQGRGATFKDRIQGVGIVNVLILLLWLHMAMLNTLPFIRDSFTTLEWWGDPDMLLAYESIVPGEWDVKMYWEAYQLIPNPPQIVFRLGAPTPEMALVIAKRFFPNTEAARVKR
jgi:hypothetical protein